MIEIKDFEKPYFKEYRVLVDEIELLPASTQATKVLNLLHSLYHSIADMLEINATVTAKMIVSAGKKSIEIDRLNAYAMRLLSDETRLWHCDNCGSDFSGVQLAVSVLPDHTMPCPICEKGTARPKAWVMQETIDRLTSELAQAVELDAELQQLIDDYIPDDCKPLAPEVQ